MLSTTSGSSAAPASREVMSDLSLLLFGSGEDPRQQVRLKFTLLAAAAYVGCMLALAAGYAFGIVQLSGLVLLTVYDLTGASAFYLALRNGWDHRLGSPGLLVPQVVYALLSLGLAYLVIPEVRSVLMVVAPLILMFGAVSTTPRECRRLAWVAVAIFGAAMLLSTHDAAGGDSPKVVLFQWLFLAAVYPAVGHVASLNSAIRIKSRQQQVELREALARIQRLATCDELTELPNRRRAVEALGIAINHAQRYDTPLCIGVIDLDHFKRVNDTHGHAVGDEVLRHLADIARPLLRSTDMLARWGGEEFLLLLPETLIDTATAVMERLRADLALSQPSAQHPALKVTFSTGLTALHAGETAEQVVERADRLLYQAKAQGRDRVIAG
jgi:diguanylate cyclase (GGDEF)-like protein